MQLITLLQEGEQDGAMKELNKSVPRNATENELSISAKGYFKHLRAALEKPFGNHVCSTRPLDNKNAKNEKGRHWLNELRKEIVRVAEDQPYWREKHPIKWLYLADKLEEKRKMLVTADSEPLVTFSEGADIASSLDVEREELEAFLTFQHNLGELIWFDEDRLRDTIILCPQWLGNVFR